MLFDPLKRGELSTLLGRTAVLPGEGQQGQPLSCSPASKLDRGIHVLILIPTLNVGGAEMDLVRVVPRIDRARFRVTVCTFLERGELSEVMQSYGSKSSARSRHCTISGYACATSCNNYWHFYGPHSKRPRQLGGNIFAGSPNQYGSRWQRSSPSCASANTYRHL